LREKRGQSDRRRRTRQEVGRRAGSSDVEERMMRGYFLVLLLLCLASCGNAAVIDERPAPPAPKSADAQKAKTRFDEAVAAARKRYLEDLEEAVKKATQPGDLNDAVLIRELKAFVEAGGEKPKP